MSGPLKLYKSYSFTDKDPIIDRLRTAVEDGGESYSKISEQSGVSATTLYAWFQGDTKRPQFATVAAVFGSLGFDLIPTSRKSAKVVPIRARKTG